MSEILTTKEVAKILRFHPITILSMAKNGKIPGAFKLLKDWRYDRNQIEEWIRGGGDISGPVTQR